MTSTAAPLAIADRALLAALRGWSEEVDARFWNGFEPGWRQLLQSGWNEVRKLDPEEARDQVRREQAAQRHPDWSRIHPSWWLRALKNESPAVQRAVVAHAPPSIRGPLQTGLGLSDDDLRSLGTPLPEALNAALALWAERLVGDWPDRADLPVIVALSQLDLPEITRLIAAVGLAKWTLSGADISASHPHSHARTLHRAVQTAFSALDPQLKTQAELDVAQFGQVERDTLGSIGLITFARLLGAGEPYRVRWALQHLPYSVARLLRTQMTRAKSSVPAVLGWESALLQFVWDQLRDEGRVKDPRGAMP
ncbi:hypothetical protein SAMN05444166_1257 [Singulisphaera sp. GP187]|uniref:hypothetical protein n=1 Tax=Singulisphaera sp. GP187 TaxID=1882752 RepID=UPI00092C45F9|nr:hypothetical protein [Singulisphaera sp. GP187]SIN84938.1 hypothetical protein SAMN05444166_1257 [Singulisphaera sp. GP187]